ARKPHEFGFAWNSWLRDNSRSHRKRRLQAVTLRKGVFMSSAEFSGSVPKPQNVVNSAPTGTAANLRIWPVILFAALLWIFFFASDLVELSMFHRFVSRMAFNAVILLCFLVWWLGFSRARWSTRLLGFFAVIGGLVLASLISDKTMNAFAILLSSFIF